MKTKLLSIAIGSLIAFFPAISFAGQEPKIDSLPAVVINTIPQSGSTNVEPGEMELKVTFSKEMDTNGYTWGFAWENSQPQSIGEPRFDPTGRTCILKVRLEPGKTYGYMLNTGGKHNSFVDKKGKPSMPYLLVFSTKPATK